jgi:16S rRNA (guanine527-N7)-methyltransferase
VARGLSAETQDRLALLGDLLVDSPTNVTAIREPLEIERMHFLDSLCLLDLPEVRHASSIVDIGSGAGLPALVLALALPEAKLVALESQKKKCIFIRRASAELALANVSVACARAEDYGRGRMRGSFDLAVSRALAPLAVIAELSVPLVRLGGAMVAMKGSVSNQERMRGENALAILGASSMDVIRMDPFPGAENRWVYVAVKKRETEASYPRRPGMPAKRPLGT